MRVNLNIVDRESREQTDHRLLSYAQQSLSQREYGSSDRQDNERLRQVRGRSKFLWCQLRWFGSPGVTTRLWGVPDVTRPTGTDEMTRRECGHLRQLPDFHTCPPNVTRPTRTDEMTRRECGHLRQLPDFHTCPPNVTRPTRTDEMTRRECGHLRQLPDFHTCPPNSNNLKAHFVKHRMAFHKSYRVRDNVSIYVFSLFI